MKKYTVILLITIGLSLFGDTDYYSGYSLNNQGIGNLANTGRYYSFDGTDQRVDVSYNPSMQTGTGGFAVAMTCKFNSSGDSMVVEYGEGLSDGWLLSADVSTDSNNIKFKAFGDSVMASVNVRDRKVFVCGVYTTSVINIYVDGVYQANTSTSGDINNTDDIHIGSIGTSDYKSGNISKFLLIDGSIDNDDVKALYSNETITNDYILKFLPSSVGSWNWLDNSGNNIHAEVKGAVPNNIPIGGRSMIYTNTTSTTLTLTDALPPGWIVTSVIINSGENITNFNVAKEAASGSQYLINGETANSKIIAFTEISNHDLIASDADIYFTLTGNSSRGVRLYLNIKKIY